MAERKHGNFGGDWTEEKLGRLAKYLPAYANVLKGRAYKYAYIDAFAGPGYRERRRKQAAPNQDLWDEDPDELGRRFTAGSAIVAMQSEPPFLSYIFIEHDALALAKLEHALREKFPQRISHVAPKPLVLCNSNNAPMFALFFAAAHPKYGATAVRIAQDVLRA